MELWFFAFFTLLAIAFFVAGRKYLVYDVVLHAVSVALFVLLAFLVFQEGITQTYGVQPSMANTTCGVISNCSTGANSTCAISQSCSNAFYSGNSIQVQKKDNTTYGIGTIYIAFALWLAIVTALRQWENSKREDSE